MFPRLRFETRSRSLEQWGQEVVGMEHMAHMEHMEVEHMEVEHMDHMKVVGTEVESQSRYL